MKQYCLLLLLALQVALVSVTAQGFFPRRLCRPFHPRSEQICINRSRLCELFYNIPLKWVPPYGCQCAGFCGYRFFAQCVDDPVCEWRGPNPFIGRCVNKVTGTPNNNRAICPRVRNPTNMPTRSPATSSPTRSPFRRFTRRPTSSRPTRSPFRRFTPRPSANPTTSKPTANPTTSKPTANPTTSKPTANPTTSKPTASPSKRRCRASAWARKPELPYECFFYSEGHGWTNPWARTLRGDTAPFEIKGEGLTCIAGGNNYGAGTVYVPANGTVTISYVPQLPSGWSLGTIKAYVGDTPYLIVNGEPVKEPDDLPITVTSNPYVTGPLPIPSPGPFHFYIHFEIIRPCLPGEN